MMNSLSKNVDFLLKKRDDLPLKNVDFCNENPGIPSKLRSKVRKYMEL